MNSIECPSLSSEPVSKRPLLPDICGRQNFYPRNMQNIPVVKIFAFLELEQI
jgi:hypothetical protein